MIDPRTSNVLETMSEHGVRCLLVGGQACVIYGAAEFSKDVDFLVMADAENFERIRKAASALKAEVIAVPPFEKKYLDEGLAIHLRGGVPGAEDFRIDLMSKMRGVGPFAELWERRTIVEGESFSINLMSVADLVRSKKTQREKDWPMIQRLVEVHYLNRRTGDAGPEEKKFWFREMRTAELIVEIAERFPEEARDLETGRPLLKAAGIGDITEVRRALTAEIEAEKEADRRYWEPLKARLGELRRAARRDS